MSQSQEGLGDDQVGRSGDFILQGARLEVVAQQAGSFGDELVEVGGLGGVAGAWRSGRRSETVGRAISPRLLCELWSAWPPTRFAGRGWS